MVIVTFRACGGSILIPRCETRTALKNPVLALVQTKMIQTNDAVLQIPCNF